MSMYSIELTGEHYGLLSSGEVKEVKHQKNSVQIANRMCHKPNQYLKRATYAS